MGELAHQCVRRRPASRQQLCQRLWACRGRSGVAEPLAVVTVGRTARGAARRRLVVRGGGGSLAIERRPKDAPDLRGGQRRARQRPAPPRSLSRDTAPCRNYYLRFTIHQWLTALEGIT